jgi:hypothetical protein
MKKTSAKLQAEMKAAAKKQFSQGERDHIRLLEILEKNGRASELMLDESRTTSEVIGLLQPHVTAHKKNPNIQYHAENKKEFQRIVKVLYTTLPKPPSTVKGWLVREELAAFSRTYADGHTLRDWINEALPGTLKRGRPIIK